MYLVAHVDANVMRGFCIVMSMCVVCGVRNTDLPGLRWVINYNLSCAKQNCAWTRLGLSWDPL